MAVNILNCFTLIFLLSISALWILSSELRYFNKTEEL